jgi:hypothetical protein
MQGVSNPGWIAALLVMLSTGAFMAMFRAGWI